MGVDVASGQVGVVRALGDPLRWRIVEALAAEELCVCHLVDDLDIPQPLVSHHLKVLRDAGIVESERFRQWTYYRLVAARLADVGRELAHLARTSRAAARNRRPCC
jgi:ArsR family transcriptional regulator